MEMLISFRGDKHEFYLVVIKLRHARSCPKIRITSYPSKHGPSNNHSFINATVSHI